MEPMEGTVNRELKKYYLILLALIGFATAGQVGAGERYEFYNGVRSLGMGGASVAVVNDETALLLNPAALGKLRNYFVTVADPELELGEETQNMIDLDIMAFMDPQETLDAVEAKPGKHFHQRAQLFPSFVVTNFGMGLYARYATDAYSDNPATTYYYDYRNDFAAVLGFNFRLFDGRLKFGVNARAVNRIESHRDDIPLGTLGLDLETQIGGTTIAKEGFGVASDVGVILTAPWQWLPTLAVVYRDAGTTTYNMNTGMFLSTTERPERTPATLDAGLAVFPIASNKTRLSFTAEMVDVMDAVEPTTEEAADEMNRRLHYGLEFNYSDTFFLRAGMNQGYWTAGFEISMYNTQLQLATYCEEVGDVVPTGSAATYDAIEDRRYVAKFAYRF